MVGDSVALQVAAAGPADRLQRQCLRYTGEEIIPNPRILIYPRITRIEGGWRTEHLHRGTLAAAAACGGGAWRRCPRTFQGGQRTQRHRAREPEASAMCVLQH
jgi:hypothetical protein